MVELAMATQESVKHHDTPTHCGSMLIRPGATSEHRVLSSDTGCGQSSHRFVFEEGLSTIGIYTRNVIVQSCTDSCGLLGRRFGGGGVCQLRYGYIVAVVRP